MQEIGDKIEKMSKKKKAILRVLNVAYPEVTSTYDDLFGEVLGDCMKVETRAQAEIALKKPEDYRGVFLETLRVRTGNTQPSKLNLYNMGNGIDIIRMAKDNGLPVIVMSEASSITDADIISRIKCADAIFEMPSCPEDVLAAMERVFV